MLDLKQQLQQDLQDAMRAQDQQRVTVLRMLIAAVEQAQEEMGKQAAVDDFRAGGHIERAEQEETEIAILEEYLEKI